MSIEIKFSFLFSTKKKLKSNKIVLIATNFSKHNTNNQINQFLKSNRKEKNRLIKLFFNLFKIISYNKYVF